MSAVNTFAERLKFLRERERLSMSAFADRICYDKSYISRLESGLNKNPSLKFIEDVCKLCGANRPWLEKGEGEPLLNFATDPKARTLQTQNDARLEDCANQLQLTEALRFIMAKMEPEEMIQLCIDVLKSEKLPLELRHFWGVEIGRAMLFKNESLPQGMVIRNLHRKLDQISKSKKKSP